MHRRLFNCYAALVTLWSGAAVASESLDTPDAIIKRLAADVASLADDAALAAGDTERASAFVDGRVMPHVDFVRMTASTVGRAWRQATPDQRARLQQEFQLLLVRSYAGALTQLKNIAIVVKPLRSSPEDTEVIVRTMVTGRGDPIQLDYRMRKSNDGWKIYDLNILGVWLVDAYRGQFSAEINARGIDGLITALERRNRTATNGSRVAVKVAATP